MGECQSVCCDPGKYNISNSSKNHKNLKESRPDIINEISEKISQSESKFKTITFDNDAVYTGELKDGMIRNGYGKQLWPDGTM